MKNLFQKRRVRYSLSWALIFVSGVLVFWQMYAAYPACDTMRWPEIFVRSCAASFDLFLFNIDSNVVDGWLEYAPSTCLGICFAIVAIAAAAWTISIIAQLVIVLTRKWRHQRKALHKNHTRLYIFVGINHRSKLLATDLLQQDPDKTVCLFIVPPSAEQEGETSIWDQLFRSVSYKHAMYKDLGDIDAQVLVAEKRIVDCDGHGAAVWDELGLAVVNDYQSKSDETHILLLGDNEKENILHSLRLSAPSVSIHCHARRNSINRCIEDVTDGHGISAVDSSHLAIELLKQNPEHQPIRFVDLSAVNKGTVSSAFRAMIIGFSECGQDALRFLYEFGAFLDAANQQDEDQRSPFFCDIIDKQPTGSAIRWMEHAQALFNAENADGSPCIRTHFNTDYRSTTFYENILAPAIDAKLNCVFIALGNDHDSISLAVDILRYAIVRGRVHIGQPVGDEPSSERFRIYVRSYDPAMYDYVCQIANHYNEGDEYIVIFGAEQELYTKDMLINNVRRQQAKAYFYNYKQLEQQTCGYDVGLKEDKDKQWEARCQDAFTEGSKVQIKNGGKLGATLNLRREISQDYANVLHRTTKRILFDHGASILRVAQTEHLRWRAAHEIMGFMPEREGVTGKSILRYVHPDMRPWKDLGATVQKYDYLTLYGIRGTDDADITAIVTNE